MWITYCDPLPRDPLPRDPLPRDSQRSVCSGPHEARSELHIQTMRNSLLSEQIDIVIGYGFGWLTLNIIEFATKDMHRLLPGRNFGLPLNRDLPASLQNTPSDCVATRNVNSHPPLRSDAVNLTVKFQDHETAQVVRRLAHQSSPLDKGDSR